MKILLFGGDGQVGWELRRSLSIMGELVAPLKGDRDLCGDLSDVEGLAAAIRQSKPDVIVNAAAYTAVDKAESEPDVANRINALAPGALAQFAEAAGAWLVHFSTDYVFDGSGSAPWKEGDATGPLNVYGASKLEGERLVARHCSRHLILRTSWVYSARGGNFARTMLRLAGDRERLTVIDDQFGAPTGADILADVTAHALRASMREPSQSGLYHVAAAGETTWNGYARFVIEQAALAGVPLKTVPMTVDPVPSSAFTTAARRPRNSRLDTGKLRSVFNLEMPHWQLGVSRMLTEII